MHNYMSFYIKPKTEHARGAEPNYLYSHFSAVFPAESLTIGRAELNTALVYTCTCMYGLFPYLSTYMYIVLETHTQIHVRSCVKFVQLMDIKSSFLHLLKKNIYEE